MAPQRRQTGAIGFRVKTGYAIAVLLAGPVARPQVLGRRTVQLFDPKGFYARQPYHAALDLPEKEAAKVVERATKSSRSLAIAAVHELVAELKRVGLECRGIGLAVGSLIDPATLGNDHMRAHALEGQLYRVVLEAGADVCHLPHHALVERDAYKKAAEVLRRTPAQLQKAVSEMGAPVGRPWRAEEKLATLAAWVSLVK